MIQSDFIYTIARTFPESILLILSGIILLDIKKDKNYILKQGLILGVIVSIIRRLPISFGVHTLLSMIAIGAILFNIYRESLLKPIIATCQIWISLAISEGIYMLIATQILSINIENLVNNTGLQGAIITLPSLGIFFITIIIIYKIENKIKNKIQISK